MAKKQEFNQEQLFGNMVDEILKVDPVAFCKRYLTIDGGPIDLSGGWRYMADICRYIGTESLKPNAKPVIIVKGRQNGATTLAAALEMYFCTSDLFGTNGKPPIRILHCFPSLPLVQMFVRDKLPVIMRGAKDEYVLKHSLSYNADTGKRRVDVPEDTLNDKQFKNENKLHIDSNANNAQRLDGMTLDCIFYDEVQRMRSDDISKDRKSVV